MASRRGSGKAPRAGRKPAPSPFARATPRASPFARAKSGPLAPANVKLAPKSSVDDWAKSLPPPSPMNPNRLEELRSQNDLAVLEATDALNARDIERLKKLDPNKYYFFTVVIKNYPTGMDDESDVPDDYDTDSRTLAFMGKGKNVVETLRRLALNHSEMRGLRISPVDQSMLKDPKDIRPLWHDDLITLESGMAARGKGIRFDKPRKPGPRKKRNSVNRRRFLDREEKRKQRHRATQKKILAIRNTKGAAAADAYEARVRSGRKGAQARKAREKAAKKAKRKKK